MNDISKQEPETAVTQFAGVGMTQAMPTALALYLNDALFERVSAIAQRLAKAQGVTPKHLIGQPEACFAVVSRAITWRLDPFAVAGATYQTPGGQIGFEGKLVLAILENSGRLEGGGVRFEHYGDWSKVQGRFEMRESQRKDEDGKPKKYAAATWTDADARGGKPTDAATYPLAQSCGVRVSARVRGEHEPRHMDFDLIQAQPRNSTLWATDPKTQICYTAARRFANAVVPALMMGVPFDPLENMGTMIDVTPERADVINMPTARRADEPKAPEAIDKQTGEITAGTTVEKAVAAAQNDAQATQPPDDVGKGQPAGTVGADGLFPGERIESLDTKDLKAKASPAQRKMVADMAARLGLSMAQLDEKLVERFAFGIDELPLAMVKDVSAFVGSLAPAKRA